ncbi:hypothetical protein [Ferruginibacter albus]|uniref:hypothetical protein n=1 Tax=Ferruginibacter albus TaxID=2875540 RepID=UPI001CC57E59|nr:hypothetical protein [Ferruginibacter albus]UAY53246.1 hypothetical protein K9M53_06135 [Ferruginibacter albus]
MSTKRKFISKKFASNLRLNAFDYGKTFGLLVVIGCLFFACNSNVSQPPKKNNMIQKVNSGNDPDPYIESVVSSKYVPPVTDINNSPMEAANLILDALNQWAAIKCSHDIDASLSVKWNETKVKYIGSIPAGSTVEFLVLVDKFTCNVIGMVHKTQVVRVKENACSVNDIKLESPDLMYNPDQTGFFSIKMRF